MEYDSKINLIKDNTYYYDTPKSSESSESSESSITSSYDLVQQIDTFYLQPYDIEAEMARQTVICAIYELTMMIIKMQEINRINQLNRLNQLNQLKITSELFNIKELIDAYNNALYNIAQIFNKYAVQINNVLRLNIRTVSYHPVVLKNYYLPVSDDLVNFINSMKNNVIGLYKQVLDIPKLIPKTKNIYEINQDIHNRLLRERII